MMTEKTPLTNGYFKLSSLQLVSFYVDGSHQFYSRRRRERQLQCITFVTIISTFTMALIITMYYSVNHEESLPLNINTSNSQEVRETLSIPKQLSSFLPLTLKKSIPVDLDSKEKMIAVQAANEAIVARRLADALTLPLTSPSPNSRHQFAMSTSRRADQLAFVAVGEIAATKKIENHRSFMGKPTSFGSTINIGSLSDQVCEVDFKSKCLEHTDKYRTFDGTCNHPLNLGRSFTPFKRLLPADYADGIEAPRIGKFGNRLPSARKVSLQVHPPSPSANPSFTVMLAVFGQFLDHDITATALSQGTDGKSLSCCVTNSKHPECFPVETGTGDPIYDIGGSTCIEFVRSAPAAQCKIGPRQQLNQVTAFIDGSTIYGSDTNTANSLRKFHGGNLRMQMTPDKRLLLPVSTNINDGCNRDIEIARGRYCFATGDGRANENLHLTTMHLLWARQHNFLARQLNEINPQWNDEMLFQETRRIVGAQLQHITYNEFLPIVLGEDDMIKYDLRPVTDGFKENNNSDIDPSIANHFAAAAFRFAHTLLPGLMKVTDKQKGTSSFIELHKILFNPYSLYSTGGVENSVKMTMLNSIQKTSTHVTSQLTKHLFEDSMSNSTLPCGLDLVSLNIQRGRDHGLPGYTQWRKYCNLQPISQFEDLTKDMDVDSLNTISKLYENVDDVDLYTGALAELPKAGGLVGPTFTCLIADQFQRLQLGDRYWYELNNQSGSFTEDQLKEVKKTTLARIICDTSDDITEIQTQVMRSVNSNNPITPCEGIPQLSFNAWIT